MKLTKPQEKLLLEFYRGDKKTYYSNSKPFQKLLELELIEKDRSENFFQYGSSMACYNSCCRPYKLTHKGLTVTKEIVLKSQV